MIAASMQRWAEEQGGGAGEGDAGGGTVTLAVEGNISAGKSTFLDVLSHQQTALNDMLTVRAALGALWLLGTAAPCPAAHKRGPGCPRAPAQGLAQQPYQGWLPLACTLPAGAPMCGASAPASPLACLASRRSQRPSSEGASPSTCWTGTPPPPLQVVQEPVQQWQEYTCKDWHGNVSTQPGAQQGAAGRAHLQRPAPCCLAAAPAASHAPLTPHTTAKH